MAMSNRSEGAMTALVETVAASLVEGWNELHRFQKYQIKDTMLPVLAACIDVLDAEPHKCKRGDEVEAWIKRTRGPARPECPGYNGRWDSLDALLDDYRLHADTGTPLTEEA